MISAVILIDAESDRITELGEAIADLPGVSEVYSVAGRHDLVVVARVKENADLATLVSDRIRKLPGIVGTETLIAFRVFSPRLMEGMFSVGMEQ